MLTQHVAVIAGSGSGKTVLLRRLVEEAVLAGIPAIVIDSNNDLSRLGEKWPETDPTRAEDSADEPAQTRADRAERYLQTAEVIVWTPGRARGNPLSLAPMPDFAALRGDADETNAAVEMAAAALGPMLPIGGTQGQLRHGVLMDALRHFAAEGGFGLGAFVDMLRELPPDVSRIEKAPKLAADLANALLAEQARNPLLGADAPSLDPAALLRAAAPGRVRVSVVNLTGLPSDAARQEFVGRLLMALFGHIRRHPARPEQPVLGLLVMDEAQNFAPSGQGAPSRAASVALARQARKYGLGMVFATQAPRVIDTNIVGNCTTQLFGRINAPQALETVRDMMASRGGAAEDLGRLPRGVFYLTTEGIARPVKIATRLCLSHHPANPPSEAEVIALAARARASAS